MKLSRQPRSYIMMIFFIIMNALMTTSMINSFIVMIPSSSLSSSLPTMITNRSTKREKFSIFSSFNENELIESIKNIINESEKRIQKSVNEIKEEQNEIKKSVDEIKKDITKIDRRTALMVEEQFLIKRKKELV